MVDTNIVGQKLRLIRVALGLSLDELGERASVTRQYWHQVETGVRTPNEEMIHVLAEKLGVTPHFFHIEMEAPVLPEHCHFRKQQTTPAYVTSQVMARGTLLDSFIAALDGVLKLPRVTFPDVSVRDTNDVERAAEASRLHWKLGVTGPITNMMRVVENAGAIVTYFQGVSERVDALSIDRARPIIVRSSLKESLCRQRFDLAHECGHLVMHRGLQTGDRETEDQANRFASAFLLPRAGFIPEFPIGKTLNWMEIYRLKLRWKVSVRAIIHRAFHLSLISASQFRSANIHLVKSGQARAEKYDDELPLENPELLDSALTALETRRPSTVRSIADELGWDAEVFRLVTGRPLPTPVLPAPKGNVVPFAKSRQPR